MRSSYPLQLIATAIPAGITIEQVLNGGNLLLATAAALLAILAGRWALRKQRLQAETAEIDKQIAELKLQREMDSDNPIPPP
jgi:hypothetical protein